MKISIIIPVFNAQKTIIATLNSVMSTANNETEIIIINDGSTDDTEGLIKCFINDIGNDTRINLITQSNKGVSVARNIGIKEATGDYIVFCDGDDLCSESMLDVIDNFFCKDADLMIWGNRSHDTDSDTECDYILKADRDETDVEGYFKDFLRDAIRVRMGSFAVRRQFLTDNGICFTDGCKYAEDVEFICKCIISAQRIVGVKDILFTYIKHQGSVIRRYSPERFDTVLAIRRVVEYLKESKPLFSEYEKIVSYLENAYMLKHIIYSFDANLPFYKNGENGFWKDYYSKYYIVEREIHRIKGENKQYPELFNRNKVSLFLFNRRLYMWVFSLRY